MIVSRAFTIITGRNLGQVPELAAQIRLGDLLIERKNVDSIVLAGIEPVLIGLTHFGTEFFVELLAGAGTRVAVDTFEVARDATDESSFQDRAVALALIFAEDRVRVAVDRFGIAGEADQVVLAIPGDAVGFADEARAVEHPDGDGRARLQQVALICQRKTEIRVVLHFERHGALDRVVELKRDGHLAVLAGGTSAGIIMCLFAVNQGKTARLEEYRHKNSAPSRGLA